MIRIKSTGARIRTAVTAAAIIGLAAFVPASSASAAPAQTAAVHTIHFRNIGTFTAQSCYEWDGSNAGDYCNTYKTQGQTWSAGFPSESTGAHVSMDYYTGSKFKQFDNKWLWNDRDWCVTFSGSLFSLTADAETYNGSC